MSNTEQSNTQQQLEENLHSVEFNSADNPDDNFVLSSPFFDDVLNQVGMELGGMVAEYDSASARITNSDLGCSAAEIGAAIINLSKKVDIEISFKRKGR
ncbi:MAG: hypothetical protein OIF57_06670 [Marinobacterium sp.]|nr:hypothetical protein [Marinobacterium sp.]